MEADDESCRNRTVAINSQLSGLASPVTPHTAQMLLALFDSTIQKTEVLLGNVRRARLQMRDGNRTDDEEILNVIEFHLLFQFDLCCLSGDLLDHRDQFRGNLYSRLLVLTIYESLKTLRGLMGAAFRSRIVAALKHFPDGTDYDAVLRDCHSDLCQLFDESNRTFAEVRNGIVAHREKSPDIRDRLIEAASNHEAVFQLALGVLDMTSRLLPAITRYSAGLTARSSERIA